jgi:putative transposase
MQNQKKKHYIAEFKAKVVMEILKEEKTVSQLSAEYEIHSSQLYKWKDQVLVGLPNLLMNKWKRTYGKKKKNGKMSERHSTRKSGD